MLSLFFSVGIFHHSTIRVVQYLTCGCGILPAPFVCRDGNNPLNKINEMKTAKFFMAFMAAALLASCSDKDNDYSGDFGQIKVPDTRQLEQTAGSDDTQAAQGVTFTTEGAWTSTIAQTRAEAPDWISVSPDHGDAAGTYTLKITLEPNDSEESRSATIVITCGTSKIEISVTQEGSEDPITPSPELNVIQKIEWYNLDNPQKPEIEFIGEFTYTSRGLLKRYEEKPNAASQPELWHSILYNMQDKTASYVYYDPKDQNETPQVVTLDAKTGYWTGRTYSYSGDGWSAKQVTSYTYDANGCLQKEEGSHLSTPSGEKDSRWTFTYTWQNGNLNAIKYDFHDEDPDYKPLSITFSYDTEANPFADTSVDPVLLNTHIEYFDELALGFLGRHSAKRLRSITSWDGETTTYTYIYDAKDRISRIDLENRNGEYVNREYAIFTYAE